MTDAELLSELQHWYASNCDGDWEHDWGVRIGTLDNPGWRVGLNLEGTPLEEVGFERVSEERSEHDWYICQVKEKVFEGRGGPENLRDILREFVRWWRAHQVSE